MLEKILTLLVERIIRFFEAERYGTNINSKLADVIQEQNESIIDDNNNSESKDQNQIDK